MGKWKKNIVSIGVSASLIAGAALAPGGTAFSKTLDGKHVGISAVSVNSPLLQKKLEEKKSPLSEDTLIIKYEKPLTISEHKRLGGTLVRQVSGLNYAVVRVKDKKNLHNIISKYQQLEKVVSVTPSVLYQQLGFKDPKAGEQYHLTQLQIEKAQKLAGKNKVKVAVIDTGIDKNHPDLRGKIIASKNTVNPISPGVPDFHGTHVAGIIAAKKDNGIGGYGVHPDADIISIDVFDRGWGVSDYSIAEGILEAVRSGAKVINMSLGGPMPSPVIEEAVKHALAKNVVVIAAAGNSASDWTNYPAGYEGVISVGSVNKYKKLSSYSSYGPSIDIVAPGEDVYSTIYEPEKLSSFRKMSGTSMASPVAAGVAALLLSKNPNLTPAQVEYILEHTAEDLGDKEFDVKFGHGLVDPVKALQFDQRKLPAIIKKAMTEKQIFDSAKQVKIDQTLLISDAITKPFEEKWIKFNVKKGDNIQAVLSGTPNYDYKLMIRFTSAKTKKIHEINKVREGKAEGKLFEAPADGVLAIGVKDANGNYDDSAKKLSKYMLQVEKAAGPLEDESSLENPVAIETIPFSTDELPLTLTGKDGDDDYFTFSVEEKQVVKLEVSAVPGVNTTISVYQMEMMPGSGDMPEGEYPEGEYPEGKYSAAHEGDHGEEMEPMHYSNNGGLSENETLTFTAEPGMPYTVKVSNKPSNYYGMYEFFYGFGMYAETEAAPESSLVPYLFSISGKVMPADEDNLPYMEEEMMPEEPAEEEEYVEGMLESQRELIGTASAYKAAHEGEMDEYLMRVQENALPYTIGQRAEGYLSSFEDEDWFQINPKQTGIYEFTLDKTGNIPWFEIYQIVTDKTEQGEEFTWLNYIGTNVTWDMFSDNLNTKVYTGLEKGSKYFIKLNNDYMRNQISFSPYAFTSRLVTKNAEDRYEDNDKIEKVKDLPGSVVEGNFGMPNDQDVFYFQAKADQIYGITLERSALTKEISRLPKEVRSPFYGFVQIVEDKNKNRKLDEKEYNLMQFIEKGVFGGYTFGSFKAKKGKNYIIIASGWPEGSTPLTLMPYKLTVEAAKTKDEDAGNQVTNNKASKPIKMKKLTIHTWESTGHFNSGLSLGDQDWYTFTLDQTASGVIKLEGSIETDGKIELYKDGKLIQSADFYPEGDAEVLSAALKKGTYQVKITDFHGGSTIKPYKLKVYMK